MQQLSSYYQTLINQERPYVPTKFRQKVNESTPNYKKKLKCQQSINVVKDLLEERQKHWLIELNDYDKNIQQFVETLSLCNNDKESMITKYRSNVKEDETRNANNWNKHFDKLKETHLEQQDSNEIDNLLKYPEKPPTNENRQIHRNYQKNDYHNYHRSRKRNPRRF